MYVLNRYCLPLFNPFIHQRMTPVCSLVFTFLCQPIATKKNIIILIMSNIQTCLYGLAGFRSVTFVRQF